MQVNVCCFSLFYDLFLMMFFSAKRAGFNALINSRGRGGVWLPSCAARSSLHNGVDVSPLEL